MASLLNDSLPTKTSTEILDPLVRYGEMRLVSGVGEVDEHMVPHDESYRW
jgi:hypothetical protein